MVNGIEGFFKIDENYTILGPGHSVINVNRPAICRVDQHSKGAV